MPQIQFASQSYQARSPNVSSERCINLYLEQNPSGAKGNVTLYGTPGLKLWNTIGSGPIRGIIQMLSKLYVVSGNELYVVEYNGTATLVGTVEGVGRVRMTENGTHVLIITNTYAYAATASTIVQLSVTHFNGVTFQDGRGIFTKYGTNELWWTDLDDMTTIGGASYATVDVLSDNVIGCISNHREIWIFKEQSTEVWYNSGDPFARASTGFIETGCRASGSIAKAERLVFWLGHDLKVYAAQGYQAQAISTTAIHKLIAERSDPGAAQADIYTQENHTFYVLTFPDLTIAYDLTTGLWHERVSDGIDRWRAQCHCFAWGTHFIGDYDNGNVYELDLDTYDENGDTLRRSAVAPPAHAEPNRLAFNRLWIDIESGVGLTSGQGSDPVMMLDWSEDGGHTWSNERWAKMGKIGEYKYRTSWTRLGQSRDRHFRVAIADPVKVAIIAAHVEAEARA